MSYRLSLIDSQHYLAFRCRFSPIAACRAKMQKMNIFQIFPKYLLQIPWCIFNSYCLLFYAFLMLYFYLQYTLTPFSVQWLVPLSCPRHGLSIVDGDSSKLRCAYSPIAIKGNRRVFFLNSPRKWTRLSGHSFVFFRCLRKLCGNVIILCLPLWQRMRTSDKALGIQLPKILTTLRV